MSREQRRGSEQELMGRGEGKEIGRGRKREEKAGHRASCIRRKEMLEDSKISQERVAYQGRSVPKKA